MVPKGSGVSVVVLLGTCQTSQAEKGRALVSQADLRTCQEQPSFVDFEGDRRPVSEPWTAACVRETRVSARAQIGDIAGLFKRGSLIQRVQPWQLLPSYLRSALPWFWQAAHSLRRLPLSVLRLKASRGLAAFTQPTLFLLRPVTALHCKLRSSTAVSGTQVLVLSSGCAKGVAPGCARHTWCATECQMPDGVQRLCRGSRPASISGFIYLLIFKLPRFCWRGSTAGSKTAKASSHWPGRT